MAERHEQTWDTLQQFLDRFVYEDGSRTQLVRDDASNFALLYVYLHAPNSYRQDRADRFTRHEFVVPVATYDYANWRRWVFERLCSAAAHEVCEWFAEIDPDACIHCGAHDDLDGDHSCPCPWQDGKCPGHAGPWRVRVFAPHHGNGEDPYVVWTPIDRSAERVALAPGEDLE